MHSMSVCIQPNKLATPNMCMQAARYQMIIMFVIAATTSVGAVATLYMASSYCIDACCRLRLDRVAKRDKANAWNARLGRRVAQVLLTWAVSYICCPMLTFRDP